MNKPIPKWKIFLNRLVLLVMCILVAVSLINFVVSPTSRHIFLSDLLARPGGPMTFRFILQPVMAAIAAIREGIKDARTGRTPYFWTIVSNRSERMERLREGLNATSQIILLGLVMDAIYQFIVLNSFHPGQAVLVALLLGFIPYVILRGPVSRIARLWIRNKAAPSGPNDKSI